MNEPALHGLSASIVPHNHWATRKWFYANPLWYYHRAGTDEEIVAGRKFYQLVDPELRDLCKLLNDRGLHTTPSCQGHFYPRERFERIWQQLTDEAESIRGQGLSVRDSETDRTYRFQQPDYRLDWSDFDAFYTAAGQHQGTGYLGIVIPDDRTELIARLCSASGRRDIITMGFDEHLSQSLGGRLFNILVRPTNDPERTRAWRTLTTDLRRLLESTDTAPSTHPAPTCDASAELWAT